MLPETESARQEYIEFRDHRNRWRQMILRRFMGDQDEFKGYVLETLGREAELASFQEVLDFAETEGFLTPEQLDAGRNAVAWGQQLRQALPKVTGGDK